MKISDYIASFLYSRRVPYVFEMCGGMITHILDSLHRQNNIRIVSVHHEQTAAFAADAVGRITGIPGVALATSGPGATNLLTGIGSCYFDSSPAVFITGQVNRNELKGEHPVRQMGFQETDIVSIARPLTKAAWQARTPEEVPELLRKAFALACDGRPGPVLLDFPMDVQRAVIPDQAPDVGRHTSSQGISVKQSILEEVLAQLDRASRPLILAGGGIHSAGAVHLLRKLVQRIQVPVVSSLMAIDALAYDEQLRVGMIGSYGNRWANHIVGKSDCVLVLGSRLDVRQTGALPEAFKGDRVIIHVDCEPGEINNRVKGCQAIVTDLKAFLDGAIQLANGRRVVERADWLAEIGGLKRSWPDTAELSGLAGINPNRLMHHIARSSAQAAVYVTDVGQHQMWAAQSLEIRSEQRFLTSGGMGSMGFGLPASIGAALVVSPRPVVLVAGDGGFQSNIQELQTVVRNCLPIKIVIVNNGCHGMVRQFQESYFGGRYQSTLWGYSAPDFARVASAYGMAGRTVDCEDDLDQALQWLWQKPNEPALLQVMISPYANVYPKIAFGRPMTEMEPFATPLEMEGT